MSGEVDAQGTEDHRRGPRQTGQADHSRGVAMVDDAEEVARDLRVLLREQ